MTIKQDMTPPPDQLLWNTKLRSALMYSFYILLLVCFHPFIPTLPQKIFFVSNLSSVRRSTKTRPHKNAEAYRMTSCTYYHVQLQVYLTWVNDVNHSEFGWSGYCKQTQTHWERGVESHQSFQKQLLLLISCGHFLVISLKHSGKIPVFPLHGWWIINKD